MDVREPATIAGVKLSNKLMNAAYIGSKSAADIEKLVLSVTGAVIVGSVTVKPRSPNLGKGYWRHKDGIYSINSYGMPNGGIPYYEKELPIMVRRAHTHNKPLITNLAGFAKEEYKQLITLSERSGADIAELNFGCPNVWSADKQKRIVSYHADLVRETLEYVGRLKPKIKIAVKISPLPPDILKEVGQVIADSGVVSAVVATNSYPNASLSSGTAEQNEDFLAGMTGKALKPISLGVVRQLHDLLPGDIAIIGCGGISSANDVKDYLSAGASSIQLATALVDDGLTVFDKILEQSAMTNDLR